MNANNELLDIDRLKELREWRDFMHVKIKWLGLQEHEDNLEDMDAIDKQLPVIFENFCEEQLKKGNIVARAVLKQMKPLERHIDLRTAAIDNDEFWYLWI